MQLQRAQSWPSAHALAAAAPRASVVVAAPAVPAATRPRAKAPSGAPRPAATAQWRVPQAQARPCNFHRTSISASMRPVHVPSAGAPPTALASRTSGGRPIGRHSSSGIPQQHQHQHHQRTSVRAASGWGAPVEFHKAKIVSNTVEAAGMHKLVVDVGGALAAQYKKPGQYVQAKVLAEGKAGFFAIASAPDAHKSTVELLIKVQPASTAEEICKLAAGAELLVSAPQGNGFPVERIPASDVETVLLFATGSGISPIKAVIESDVLEVGKRKEVRLYYGSRSPELTAYKSLIPEWTAKGIKVVQVLSGSSKKYVQGVFAEEAGQLRSPGKVGVLLCGQKDMSIAIKELCKEKGVPQEAVLSNF